MKISVIVCTHNRCGVLQRTLNSLASQDYPASDYEVIVVDNNSTDSTRDVVYGFMSRRVRYVFEEKVGLSHARNRGIEESEGSIVAFIDDDARAEKPWLMALQKVYDEKKDAMCVGGKVVLEWSSPKPSWWSGEMDSHLSAVDYGNGIKKLTYPQYPYGTNISFRRSVFKTAGMFNPELGRIGKKLLASEEIELCLNIDKIGGGIYYCPGMVVHHLAQPDRVSKKSIKKRSYWHGRSLALVEMRHFGKIKLKRRMQSMSKQILLSSAQALNDFYTLSLIYYRFGYIQQACILILRN